MSRLECGVINADSSLERFTDTWNELHERVANSTPFQSPHWLLPWWHAFGSGRPCVSFLVQDGRLAGVLPLYAYGDSFPRKLLPIGVGVSDYLDVLLVPQLGSEAAETLLRVALACGQQHGATICDLPDIPEKSILRELSAPPGWRSLWQETELCPVLDVPPDVTNFDDVLSAHSRRKLRMNRHRAERRGGWSIETATGRTLTHFLEELARLHGARWAARGQPGGVLADRTVLAFYTEMAPELLSGGMLRIQALRMEGQVVACCLALLAGADRLLLYLTGFDPEFAHESPGSILLGEVIAAAMAEGRREIHFLRGDEAYKYSWGARPTRNRILRLQPA